MDTLLKIMLFVFLGSLLYVAIAFLIIGVYSATTELKHIYEIIKQKARLRK